MPLADFPEGNPSELDTDPKDPSTEVGTTPALRHGGFSTLDRHYSTIGIGDVFLSPPNNPLPYTYLGTGCQKAFGDRYGESLKSSEVVGVIKSCPSDFVVREVAPEGRKTSDGSLVPRIAYLPSKEDSCFGKTDESCLQIIEEELPAKTPPLLPSLPKEKPERIDSIAHSKSPESAARAQDDSKSKGSDQQINDESLEPAEEALEQQLFHADKGAKDLMDAFDALSQSVVQFLACTTVCVSDNTKFESVSFQVSERGNMSQESGLKQVFDRGVFHRAMRVLYPLLDAESTRRGENSTPNDMKSYIVDVTVDRLFFKVIPLLHEPAIDLPALYSLFKPGCSGKPVNASDEAVFLRLRPDLERIERKTVHHTIETQSKGLLESSTTNDYPLSPHDTAGSNAPSTATTTAILVRWSKAAYRRRNNNNTSKRKRTPTNPSSSEPSDAALASATPSCPTFPHCLFVVKKVQVEHLTMQHALSERLKCRQACIGLAGIKDTMAETFQFCTVADYSVARLHRALQHWDPRLSSVGTLEVGGAQAVDWLLNKGSLVGNQFRIVVRNVRRVQASWDVESSSVREELVPVSQGDHLTVLSDRVQQCGFVNFYGEQRVGAPGRASVVGVRGFDVGRAMLQRDYRKAVDLIMTGRLIVRGNDVESEAVRQVRTTWKETGGDPVATWKALPRGNVLARERLILKGLKRYGDPLLALKCLHFNERTFWISAYQSYVWNTMASERITLYGTKVVAGDLVLSSDGNVRVVDDPSKMDGKLLEFDNVVLPLPGYDVKYPTHKVGSRYSEFLAHDRVSVDKAAPPECTAKGGYRRIVARAYNFLQEAVVVAEDGAGDDGVRGSALHWKLRFDLPAGCYATMLLRELMLTTVVRDLGSHGPTTSKPL